MFGYTTVWYVAIVAFTQNRNGKHCQEAAPWTAPEEMPKTSSQVMIRSFTAASTTRRRFQKLSEGKQGRIRSEWEKTQPGGHCMNLPPRRCKCRCNTVWPPHPPSLITTRYPSRSPSSILATRLAVYNSCPRIFLCRSSAVDSPVNPSRNLGIITMCTGACGVLSWNASTSSSSYTTNAGTFFVMILSNTVTERASVIMDARMMRCESDTASASTRAACTAELRSWGSCSSEPWANFNCAVMTRSLESASSASCAACSVAFSAMCKSALGTGTSIARDAAAVGSRTLVDILAARACWSDCCSVPPGFMFASRSGVAMASAWKNVVCSLEFNFRTEKALPGGVATSSERWITASIKPFNVFCYPN